MVCGAETTPEDEFIYNPDVMEFLDKWDRDIATEYYDLPMRTCLEYFAWALKQKIDEEGW